MPPAVAAFIGALTAGIFASLIKNKAGYPRISLTVPSIVIMVPGLYLYRAIYNFGIMSLTEAVSWFSLAIMIIMALPLGLIFARILTDKTFRYWNVKTGRWEVEEGEYLIMVGACVADIRLSGKLWIAGTTSKMPYEKEKLPSYYSGLINNVGAEEFEGTSGASCAFR